MHERGRQAIALFLQFVPVRFDGVELGREVFQAGKVVGVKLGIAEVLAQRVAGVTQMHQVMVRIPSWQTRLQAGRDGRSLDRGEPARGE